MIKLSKTSKMAPIKSFALPVSKNTCIGMLDEQGKIKDVCQNCYAIKGSYSWRNAKALRKHNYEETLNNLDSFHDDMVRLINSDKNNYFRWFDSGDIYDNDLLYTIISICRSTPDTFHWIPTKARELLDQDLWEHLESLPNVKVRYSSPSTKGYFKSEHGSTVIQPGQKIDDNKVYACPVGIEEDRKNCGDCRACWHSEKVIAYTFH